MKILVADERSITRDVILRCLSDASMQPVCASDGAEAWQLLTVAEPPRMAIVDCDSPLVNGLEICRNIRNRAGSLYTYIIGLGARAAKADALSAFKAGADDYLTKPIEGSELLHRVRTGLRVLEKEEKLSRIIRGWRTMLDSLPFGVACLGHGGRLLRANMIFVSLLGYRVESLLGKSLKQTVLSDPTQFSNLMIQVRMGTPFDRVEMDMMHHDRTIRTLFVWGRPIPDTPDMVYQIITSLP